MDIKDVLQEANDTLFTESMVKELIDKDITDYERGIVKGRIEMLNWIKSKLESDDEDSSI
jgi:hypothetical protein